MLGDASDSRALVALRARLRADGQFSVVTFDPDAPSLVRAAAEAKHPEWLTDPVTSDAERLSIARALGASYAAVIAHADKSRADVHLLETAPAARVWDYVAYPTDAAAGSIERDAIPPAPVAPRRLLLRRAPAPVASCAVVRAGGSRARCPRRAGGRSAACAPPAFRGSRAIAPRLSPPRFRRRRLCPPLLVGPRRPRSPRLPCRRSPCPPPVAAPESHAARLSKFAAVPALPLRLPQNSGRGASSPASRTQEYEVAADLAAVQPLIRQADQAVSRGDMVDAYALYRQAINAAPLSDVPRLKLAQAYALGGLPDKALSEAQRALEIAPDSLAVQEFLIKFDAENGTTAGTVARYKALVIKNPEDVTAHLDLGDALWNSSAYADAETEYKSARDLAPAGSDTQRVAVAHLARLYSAMGRYDDCLAAMKAAGAPAYPLVLGVIQNCADTLAATLDSGHGDFDAGKMTRADFYDKMKAASTQSQSLADFVARIVPPDAYARSHLDRVQGLSLLAQAAAVTVNYIESNDMGRRDKAAQLEKDAQTEMLTAHAAERRLGLWGEDKRRGGQRLMRFWNWGRRDEAPGQAPLPQPGEAVQVQASQEEHGVLYGARVRAIGLRRLFLDAAGPLPLPSHAPLIVSFLRGDALYRFETRLVGPVRGASLAVARPRQVVRIQRRQFYRLPLESPTTFRPLSEDGRRDMSAALPARLVNLSGGGALLAGAKPMPAGLGVAVRVPAGVDGYPLDVEAEVLDCQVASRGSARVYLIRLRFYDPPRLSPEDREAIIAHIFEQQRLMLKGRKLLRA